MQHIQHRPRDTELGCLSQVVGPMHGCVMGIDHATLCVACAVPQASLRYQPFLNNQGTFIEVKANPKVLLHACIQCAHASVMHLVHRHNVHMTCATARTASMLCISSPLCTHQLRRWLGMCVSVLPAWTWRVALACLSMHPWPRSCQGSLHRWVCRDASRAASD